MSREKLKNFNYPLAQLEGGKVLIYNLRVKSFTLLEHDADIALEIYGRTPSELFENATYALFSIMIERETVSEEKNFSVKEIEVRGDGELLISFLNELLYLWDTERLVVERVSVEIGDREVFAKLLGERFDPKKHRVKKEIKAATYHNFSIENRDDGLVAKVVFDV